ncbi:MFS transporter [Burkholderia multivorans]|nr:MFS transporter [Burkholderia multivorans]
MQAELARSTRSSARSALAAALLGFFVITLDAVVVNVALPTISHELHAGITGLQWVVDGYTLAFAALLLSAGAFADRIGARQAFGLGLIGVALTRPARSSASPQSRRARPALQPFSGRSR